MKRAYIYVAVFIYIISMVAGFAAMNLIMIALSITMLTIGIIAYKGWHIIEPLIFKHSNIIQVLDDYQISGDRQTAIRNTKNKFASTAIATLDTSKINELDKEKIENIIKSTNTPLKLVMWIQQLNLSKLLDDLKTRQYSKEGQLSRLMHGKGDELKIDALRKAISQIEKDIAEISSGKIPLKIAYYVMVTSIAESSFSAQDDALLKLKEVTSAFDAMLNSKSRLVSGNELIEILKFDATTVF